MNHKIKRSDFDFFKMKLEINFKLKKEEENEIIKFIWENILNDLFILIKKFLQKEWKISEKIFQENIIKIAKNWTKNFQENNEINLEKIIYLNFISDEEIQKLNKESRWKNKPTDCLSFPYEPEDFIPIFWEVFIAFPYIKNQAETFENSLKNEISKMFIHSVLHLFWYDHQNNKDFEEMDILEKKIMKNFLS